MADFGAPSTWKRFTPALCHGCQADCCRLPVEVTSADLHRMGLVCGDESPKKIAKMLLRKKLVTQFRAKTGLFILSQRPNGDCVFLDSNRRCQIYDRRPEVCRQFPRIGPRPGFCPHTQK